jgi:hypothetical protein
VGHGLCGPLVSWGRGGDGDGGYDCEDSGDGKADGGNFGDGASVDCRIGHQIKAKSRLRGERKAPDALLEGY